MLKETVAENAAAIAEYGETFRGEYGWAHEQLLVSSAEYVKQVKRAARGRGPIFEDIERAVRRNDESPDPLYWRLLYAASSAAVHGSPRSIRSFGEGGRFMRVGPHLAGVWQPGEATAHRLSDLTRAFCLPNYGPDIEVGDSESVISRMMEAVVSLDGMAESAFELLGRLHAGE